MAMLLSTEKLLKTSLSVPSITGTGCVIVVSEVQRGDPEHIQGYNVGSSYYNKFNIHKKDTRNRLHRRVR